MTKSTKSATKPSADEAAKKAVEDHPGASAEGVASAAGIGRSTATKALARLGEAGEVTRFEGGREQGKRLPDRFTLAGVELPPAYAGHTAAGSVAESTSTQSNADEAAEPATTKNSTPNASASAESQPSASSKPEAPGEHLKPGQLDGLVLTYLKENAGSGPHGPSTVARALERSSGAVGNCLKARLLHLTQAA